MDICENSSSLTLTIFDLPRAQGVALKTPWGGQAPESTWQKHWLLGSTAGSAKTLFGITYLECKKYKNITMVEMFSNLFMKMNLTDY